MSDVSANEKSNVTQINTKSNETQSTSSKIPNPTTNNCHGIHSSHEMVIFVQYSHSEIIY